MVEDPAFVFGGHSVRFDRKNKRKKIVINSRNELTVSRAAVHAMQKALEKVAGRQQGSEGRNPEQAGLPDARANEFSLSAA
jgi:hypothetical protein